MGDLDDLLLEAAGRTSGGGTKRNAHDQSSKRKRQASYSDDDDDGSDSGDNSDYGHNYSRRNQSSSYVPVKKRSNNRDNNGPAIQGEKEDDHDDFSEHKNGSSDESDVGSDLYKDEDDRQWLAQLSELKREMILSERAAKRDDKKLHKHIQSSRKSKEHQSQPGNRVSPSSRSMRSSTRSADRSGAKADALNELRARRRKRDTEGTKHKPGDGLATRASYSRQYSPSRKKGLFASSPRSSSPSDSGSDMHSEDEGSARGGNLDFDSDDERFKHESDHPSFEDVMSITIRRSKLTKWFMEPFFEDLIVGCFVRVGIGMKSGQNIYRLCTVQNVDSSDPNRRYQLEGKNTFKYLNCVWGHEKSAARWQMARVSDSPPSKEEFDQWVRQVERTSGHMPTRKEVMEKKEAIEKANSFVYSAETVKHMLHEKKSKSGLSRPVNIAAEREKLRRELDMAQEKNDESEVESIKTQLRELEASRQSGGIDKKALRLQEMNRKNRVENFKVASGLKSNINPKAGEAGYDPFSRRWTQSRNYFGGKREGGLAESDVNANKDASSQTEKKVGMDAEVAATKAAMKEAAGAGKLVDTNAPVEQGGSKSNSLHEFELDITLAPLQRYGGPQGAFAAYMERKQKIEANLGWKVPEDDGRKHLLCLTVGDYKRRRGLL